MKKIYLILGLISNLTFAQLATPSAQIQATTNPTTGNVGIGTTNPQTKLDIQNRVLIDWSAPTHGIKILTSGGQTPAGWARGYFFGSKDNLSNNLGGFGAFGWANTLENYFIGSAWDNPIVKLFPTNKITSFYGNVGIGTTNPQSKLEVNGSFKAGNDDNQFTYDGHADLRLKFKNRGTGGRVIVHDEGNTLSINYAEDFNGGTKLGYYFLVKGRNASLKGKFEAKEIKVTETPTADFVFEEDYKLPTLQEVEKHIKEKKHLPEIASAKQMEKEGVNVGEFQIQLLQKIEELTLYIIEQNKRIEEQNNRIKKLENK